MLDLNEMTKMCDGNIGAASFIAAVFNKNTDLAKKGLTRMLKNNITGSKLYMLWNDCCDRNCELTLDVMLNEDINNIKKHINYNNGRGIPFKEKE